MFSILRYVISHARFFVRDQRGITTIEYGILAAGLAIIITALVDKDGTFYTALENIFSNVLDNMPQGEDSSSSPNP
jgi:pilus assembly protein Flp/PilA